MPAHHRAFFQPLEGFLLGLLFALFQNHAPVDHDVFGFRIQLGDPAFDLLPDQLLHLGLLARAASGSRHERAQSDVHAQPALHHFDHRPADGAFVRERGFERSSNRAAFPL